MLVIITLICCVKGQCETQDIDKALSDLAEKISRSVQKHGKKKIAVVDFTDLQGTPHGELGKYIAEELTVDLVMGKHDFSVLDRANLRSILAEHKLTATGLVDPENAKKLGMFAGVDVLVLGTILPKNQNINLSAKLITTDTAEIIGAARAEFKEDGTVKDLTSQPVPQPGGSPGIVDTPNITKDFGDLHVELEPLRITDERVYRLSMQMTNKNPQRSIWVALHDEGQTRIHGSVTDAAGNESGSAAGNISGIRAAFLSHYNNDRMIQATEIRGGESISVTINFIAPARITPGTCKLQLELLVAKTWNGSALPTSYNLTTKIEAR